ncbi:hypothetical protein HAX54_019946, partial [Datura stramonium]|nr:hypothetical protein [Datura stramonium]
NSTETNNVVGPNNIVETSNNDAASPKGRLAEERIQVLLKLLKHMLEAEEGQEHHMIEAGEDQENLLKLFDTTLPTPPVLSVTHHGLPSNRILDIDGRRPVRSIDVIRNLGFKSRTRM